MYALEIFLNVRLRVSVAAQCPVCGAPIEFKIGTTLVVVCESCDSVVARGDRTVEQIGKVSDLVATSSPLKLWLAGKYKGVGFQVVGRSQLRHGAGGVWDEWYLAFDDTRWGWLAEAQGKFYLTFKVEGSGAPAYDTMVPGNKTSAGGGAVEFTVAERGEAEMLSAEGEIPYLLQAGKTFRFADLSGQGGAFATVDYGSPGANEPAVVYAGAEITLADIGLQDAELEAAALHQVSSEAVSCPNCGGSLDLAAPDKTQRVICPYCDTVLDAEQGNLKKLETLTRKKVSPTIPLGTKATFDRVHYKVIGFIRRSLKSYGVRYYWEEYLLYEPRNGYRWLTYSDGHWSYVEPVPISEVSSNSGSRECKATDGERTYKIFQTAHARVEYVVGEFYWRVTDGQRTVNIDYICPPYILSVEKSDGERNWSRGRYLTHDEINGCTDCVVPKAISGSPGANQPYRPKDIYPIWAAVFAAAVLLIIGAKMRQDGSLAHKETIHLNAQRSKDASEVLFSKPFKLKARQNIILNVNSPVSNSWVYVEADLIDTDSGEVAALKLPIEYYYGYTGGEHWREGGPSRTRYLSAMSAGSYMVRLQVWRKNYRRPSHVTLTVEQGKLRHRYWMFLLIALCLVPIGVVFNHRSFEKRRWAESDYGDDE